MNRPIRFPYWFIIILLAAFAVGYLAWSESLRDDPSMTANSPNPLFSKEGAKGELERGDGGEFKGWQTYRNEEYGFEVRYPPSWFPREGGFGLNVNGVTISSTEIRIDDYFISSGIEIQSAPIGGELSDKLCPYLSELYIKRLKTTEIRIDDIQIQSVMYLHSQPPSSNINICASVSKGQRDYYISAVFPKHKKLPDPQIFDQILSTLKFIE